MKLSDLAKRMAQREERWRQESTWEAVKHQLETALTLVMDRDHELLVENASERAIAHRIAVYLEWYYQARNVPVLGRPADHAARS